MADNLKNPSTRRFVVLLVEYDSLTSPDEVARIQAESATLYEGVATAAAKAITPEKAAAVRTLLADRGEFAEFTQVRRADYPVAAVPGRTASARLTNLLLSPEETTERRREVVEGN